MNQDSSFRKWGQVSCFTVFVLGIFYAITTAIGFLSLKSSADTIGYPYFTIMEVLSIVISLLMAISMVWVHQYASPGDKAFSLIAVIFMFITAAITSSVHFLILSMGNTEEANQLPFHSFFLSFKWPSIAYALDILAWDLFFSLSILFGAAVFRKHKAERRIRTLMVVCGLLSLSGLIGIPLQNMQIRNMGIVGYAVLGPVVFLLLGKTVGPYENSTQEYIR